MAPPLPKMDKKSPVIGPIKINYKDLKEIDPNRMYYIYISKDELDLDMSLLLKVLDIDKNNGVYCEDYETLVFLDKIIGNRSNFVFLVDDGILRDRSYIDLTVLKNIDPFISIHYILWGVKFNKDVKLYTVKNTTGGYCPSCSDYIEMSLDNYKKMRTVLSELSKYKTNNDVENIYLTSDYFQSRTQYIDGYVSNSTKGDIIVPTFENYNSRMHKKFDCVLNNGFGVCVAFADFTSLLLNNDVFRIEAEAIYGCVHKWNRVKVGDKHYYVDNTWNITRSKNSPNDALITNSFNDDYLLMGTDTINQIGHHINEVSIIYTDGEDSKEDYKKIPYDSKFEYMKEPKYKSYRR